MPRAQKHVGVRNMNHSLAAFAAEKRSLLFVLFPWNLDAEMFAEICEIVENHIYLPFVLILKTLELDCVNSEKPSS